jgi:hypothetical protein
MVGGRDHHLSNLPLSPNSGLNGNHYDILESPPSSIAFSRLCHISRPVLIKGEFGGRSRQVSMR